MPAETDPLARTRPLSDPVRVITLLMAAGAAVTGIITAILCFPTVGIYGALIGLASTCAGLSLALLIGPAGKPNAIYLRAFRTDTSTAKLRAELTAILGPGFRLSGIRPPKKKTSIFLRFLVPGLIALRYAGSKFMELEAGDDWMARLWKTYQSTRLVFIDVRDVTIHVHLEIQMTMATMGAERCIFITGPGKTDAEWRETIAAIGGPQYEPAEFHLLEASEERIRSRQLQTDLNAFTRKLPAGAPGAIDRGRQFILEHVPQDLLEKSHRTSPANAISAIAALGLSFGVGMAAGRNHPLVLLPFIVLGLLITVQAMARAVGRIRRLARAGHRGAAARVALLLVVAALPFVTSVLAVTIAVPALRRSLKSAQQASAIASLRTLAQAEVLYDLTYPENGYACQLSQLGGDPQAGPPTAQTAQLIPNDLASGKKSGFTFAFAKCTKTTVNGKDQVTDFEITAVPDAPDGRRGFCMNASAEIRVDLKGGTNCTETLQY